MNSRPILAAVLGGALLLSACTTAARGDVGAAAEPPQPPAEALQALPTVPVTTPVTTVAATPPAAASVAVTVPEAPVATEPPAPPPPPLPPQRPAAFAAAENEAQREAKTAAAAIAASLLNYEIGDTPTEIASRVTTDPAQVAALVEASRPLYHEGSWSRGTVVYPQLGGSRNGAVSVMIVMRQDVGAGEAPRQTETRTLDLRLRESAGGWTFVELASAGGDPVPRPADLPAVAAAVVDDPRIELPDSARWDIYAGTISPRLLRLMAAIADHTPYGVVVLTTGHPHHVFGTDRTSNHTVGRAVDVYALDDLRVIDDRAPGSATWRFVEWLYERSDVGNIGSPWALDGTGGRSFTDDVHQDHIHIAVGR